MTALSAMTVDQLAVYDPSQDSDWLLGKLIDFVLAECPEDGSDPLIADGPWMITAAVTGLLGLPDDDDGERPLGEARANRRRRIAAWLDENRARLGG